MAKSEEARGISLVRWAMPARETEVEQQQEAAAPVVETPAPAQAEQQQEFTTEGDLPAVASTTAVASGATASELAFDGQETQASANLAHLDTGVHDPYQYKMACEQAGKPEKWKAQYANGHTEAKGWEQPHDHRRSMDFHLKKGHSASEAIQAWLKGPTIADYRAYGVADEIDEVRDTLGDAKFDLLFGSKDSNVDANIPKGQRLAVSAAAYTTPIGEQMKQIAAEHDAKANLVDDEPAAPAVEARVEEKPKAEAQPEPEVVRQELGLEQADRQIL